jgi:hypothetical protein
MKLTSMLGHEEESGSDMEENPRSRLRNQRRVDDMLFEAISSAQSAVTVVVNEWFESYEETPENAVVDLISLIVQV